MAKKRDYVGVEGTAKQVADKQLNPHEVGKLFRELGIAVQDLVRVLARHLCGK